MKYTRDDLIKLYVDEKLSLTEIGDIYSVHKSVINTYLTKFKIPRNRQDLSIKHNLKLDSSTFSASSPIFNYFVGLTLTDGYIDKHGVSIKLMSRDYELLNNLYKHFYQTTKDKRKSTAKAGTEKLAIGSKVLLLELTKFGLFPGPKTFTVSCPSSFYSEECLLMFIRGVIDGDGCIYFSKRTNTFMFNVCSASKIFALQLKQLLEKFCSSVLLIERKTSAGNPLFYVQVNGLSALSFLQKVYFNHDNFCLSRKKAIVFEYAEFRKIRVKPIIKNRDARGKFTCANAEG